MNKIKNKNNNLSLELSQTQIIIVTKKRHLLLQITESWNFTTVFLCVCECYVQKKSLFFLNEFFVCLDEGFRIQSVHSKEKFYFFSETHNNFFLVF